MTTEERQRLGERLVSILERGGGIAIQVDFTVEGFAKSEWMPGNEDRWSTLLRMIEEKDNGLPEPWPCVLVGCVFIPPSGPARLSAEIRALRNELGAGNQLAVASVLAANELLRVVEKWRLSSAQQDETEEYDIRSLVAAADAWKNALSAGTEE